jgi:fatty-acyl-CoA synthase
LPILLALYLFPRETNAKLCRWWARSLFFLCGCPLHIHGKQNLTLHYPVIYAANHQSYLDAVIFLAVLPADTRLVGKQELRTTPLLRTFMQKLDYLAVDRTNLTQGVEDTHVMEQRLHTKHALGIFPEGTFTYATGLRPFKSGAFKIAADTQTPICPIAIRGTRSILRGEERLFRPGRIDVHIFPPISPKGTSWQDVTQLKNLVRATILKECGEPSLDFINPQIEEKA